MISKSSYKRYIECPKSLWLYFNKPNEAAEMTELEKGNIENGNIVGELARMYFPNTVDCSVTKSTGEPIYNKQIEATKKAFQDGADAMAEASFLIGDLFCAVDILKKEEDGYSIYEVKSSLDVTESQLLDIAFQKYVLDKCGIRIKHIYLMHPNRNYTLNGNLNLAEYFSIECEDKNDTVIKCYNVISNTLKGVRNIVDKKDEPNVDFCGNCKNCEFNKYCTRNIPENCVASLNGISAKAYKLYNNGIITISDYVQSIEYKNGAKNPRREIQIKKLLNNDDTTFVNKTKLEKFLNNIKYPIYHLDFETTSKIVPAFEGFRPGESYPFQYSLHIEQADGTIEHKEFLGEEENCIRALAEQLVKDIPENSQLIAYHASTEINVIKDLAKKFPDLANHLTNLSNNFIDLLEPFKKGIYYNPKQKGSNSIKDVLPALCPEMADAYHKLKIVRNGGEALVMFQKLIAMKGTPEYINVRDGMLQYCKLDTLSMVEILKVLKRSIK